MKWGGERRDATWAVGRGMGGGRRGGKGRGEKLQEEEEEEMMKERRVIGEEMKWEEKGVRGWNRK